MRLQVKSLAIAMGVLWGGCMLMVGVAHQIWPGYGGAMLDLASSIYPGFHPGGYGEAVVGGLYGLVDGAVAGAVIAWVYNAVSGPA